MLKCHLAIVMQQFIVFSVKANGCFPFSKKKSTKLNYNMIECCPLSYNNTHAEKQEMNAISSREI